MATFYFDTQRLGTVPIEAETREEALARGRSMTEEEVKAIRERWVTNIRDQASRLGLSEEDVVAIESQADPAARIGTTLPGSVVSKPGTVDAFVPEGAHVRPPSGWEQMGRWAQHQGAGARQLVAELRGDPQAERLIANLDREQNQVFDMLDKNKLTWSDVAGEFPALSFFLATSPSGASGALATGFALGATDMQDELSAEAAGLGSRAIGASVNAGTAAVLGGGGRLATGAGVRSALVGDARVGGRIPFTNLRAYRSVSQLRGRAVHENPSIMRNVTDEALTALRSENPAQQALGRAVFQMIDDTLSSMPRTVFKGAQGSAERAQSEAILGLFQAALRNASVPTRQGGLRLNPQVWIQEMTAVNKGLVNSSFAKNVAGELNDLNNMVKVFSRISPNATPQSMQLAAEALIRAPARAKPMLEALSIAREPSTIAALTQGLAEIGQEVLVSTVRTSLRGASGFAGYEGSSRLQNAASPAVDFGNELGDAFGSTF